MLPPVWFHVHTSVPALWTAPDSVSLRSEQPRPRDGWKRMQRSGVGAGSGCSSPAEEPALMFVGLDHFPCICFSTEVLRAPWGPPVASRAKKASGAVGCVPGSAQQQRGDSRCGSRTRRGSLPRPWGVSGLSEELQHVSIAQGRGIRARR